MQHTMYYGYQGKQKKLQPQGHSAWIESLIQPAIIVGSTLMSAIAVYVLAVDEITRILNSTAAPSDWFIAVMCAGMGFLIDMAIIVASTRYRMHVVRDDPREWLWRKLAFWVLIIGLGSETLTLFYFFVHLTPSAFPAWMVIVAGWIHSILAGARAVLPPVIIAYFVAGIVPVVLERADRNREIKANTSNNIILLVNRLSEVYDTEDKAELLRALGGQLALDTYATYDATGRTSETEQVQRDTRLLSLLARIHRLDISVVADVVPELSAANVSAPSVAPLEYSYQPESQPYPPVPAAAPARAPAAPAETRVLENFPREQREQPSPRRELIAMHTQNEPISDRHEEEIAG